MSKKITLIAAVVFLLAGSVLLCVSMFGDSKGNIYLASALACIIIANIFNLVNAKKTRKNN